MGIRETWCPKKPGDLKLKMTSQFPLKKLA